MTTVVPPPATSSRPTTSAAAPPPTARSLDVETLGARVRRGPRVPRGLSRLSGVVVLLAVWQLLSTSGVLPRTVVGSPLDVVRAASTLTADGELGSAVLVSLQRVAEGFALGLLAGVALALVSGLTRLGGDLLDAPVQMIRTVPFAGIIPLLIIWLGVGEAPKVVLIALGVTFPVYINLAGGIRSVDPGLLEAGRTLGLSRWGLMRQVVLPGALPQLLVGIRLALGISWLALVFAEQISATNGLGYLMMTAQELLQTDTIVVCLVVYAILGLAVDLLVRGLERVLLSWRPRAVGA